MDMDEDIEMDEESLQAGTYVLSLQLLSVLLIEAESKDACRRGFSSGTKSSFSKFAWICIVVLPMQQQITYAI